MHTASNLITIRKFHSLRYNLRRIFLILPGKSGNRWRESFSHTTTLRVQDKQPFSRSGTTSKEWRSPVNILFFFSKHWKQFWLKYYINFSNAYTKQYATNISFLAELYTIICIHLEYQFGSDFLDLLIAVWNSTTEAIQLPVYYFPFNPNQGSLQQIVICNRVFASLAIS